MRFHTMPFHRLSETEQRLRRAHEEIAHGDTRVAGLTEELLALRHLMEQSEAASADAAATLKASRAADCAVLAAALRDSEGESDRLGAALGASRDEVRVQLIESMTLLERSQAEVPCSRRSNSGVGRQRCI